MEQHFGVGVGAEDMAFGFQFLPEFGEVVNFTVDDQHKRFVFRVKGLSA